MNHPSEYLTGEHKRADLPKGWRLLEPGEVILETDYFLAACTVWEPLTGNERFGTTQRFPEIGSTVTSHHYPFIRNKINDRTTLGIIMD